MHIRIVGGTASGLRIDAPPGHGTRPTGERVREAVFNSLVMATPDAKVLDLYGGSGAMGLESVSWGASSCVIVEPASVAQRVIRTNIARLRMQQQVQLWAVTAEVAMSRLMKSGKVFDVIICDPPWKDSLSAYVASHLQYVLASEGVVVLEHPSAQPATPVEGLLLERERNYGGTAVGFWRRA